MKSESSADAWSSEFRRFALTLSLLVSSMALSSCVVAQRPARRVTVVEASRPRGTVVVRETPGVGGVVIIRQAPPPPRREVIVERERPSAQHVWVPGYWAWRDRGQVWIGGHWELPPRPRAVWVVPRWERRGEGYVFIEGSWR